MYTSKDVMKLHDKTYCSLYLCKQAFEYAEAHKDCTPEGYIKAVHNAIDMPKMNFEDRVRYWSRYEKS